MEQLMELLMLVFHFGVPVVSSVQVPSTLLQPQTCLQSAQCGGSLFLTPMIEKNLLSEARRAAKVTSFLPKEPQITSYSGYLTVNQEYDSNLFFWLFPSIKNPKRAPLVLWLGGTLGTASSWHVFSKNGPYVLSYCQCQNPSYSVGPAYYHWSEVMHVIHIDSPAGVGFSFTKQNAGLAATADDVARDLYAALVQIFQLFPHYQSNDFFIIGESYSAKFVPALAKLIDSKSSNSSVNVNLKGVAIGNGWLDPSSISGISSILYEVGLIDKNTQESFSEKERTIASLIHEWKNYEAFDVLQKYVPVQINHNSTLVENVTGFSYFGNYIRSDDETGIQHAVNVVEFMNQPQIRRQLHAGDQNLIFFNETVFDRLKMDLLKSALPDLEAVMGKNRILLYSGQLDASYAHHKTTTSFLRSRLGQVTNREWYVEGELAGYVKSATNVSEVLVRNAGHQVAEDQPLWAWDLVKRFIGNLPFA